jgi:hypothetical protein
MDLETRKVLHTFDRLISYQGSLGCFYTTKRKVNSGAAGVVSFSMIYTDRQSGDCVIRSYSPRNEGEFMCFGPKEFGDESSSCCQWINAIEQIHRFEAPGEWQALPCGVVIGVRKRPSSRQTSIEPTTSSTDILTGELRRRTPVKRVTKEREEEDAWEIWMLSPKGERVTMPISDDENNPGGRHLYATSCGPMTRVGRRSIAVGLGNVMKVITVGNERFDGAEDSSEDMAAAIASRRRKLLTPRKKSYNPVL